MDCMPILSKLLWFGCKIKASKLYSGIVAFGLIYFYSKDVLMIMIKTYDLQYSYL